MKVIDLLNKIANGENPKKIKYYDDVYEFDCYEGEWGYVNKEYSRYKWFANEIDCDLQEQLNDEVEIIEEDKKIDYLTNDEITLYADEEPVETIVNFDNKELVNKINEIIDEVNKLKDDRK